MLRWEILKLFLAYLNTIHFFLVGINTGGNNKVSASANKKRLKL